MIYNVASYIELNPLFGAVFIWVIVAVRDDVIKENSEYTTLLSNLNYLGIFQAISMTALTSYLSAEAINGFGSEDKGLFLF